MITKNSLSKFLRILCLCLFILGCEKHPFDYRTKFVGDYRFNVKISHYGPYPGNPDTNYNDDGRVWYGENKEHLEIILTNGKSFDFKVYEDGTIEGGYGEFETEDKVTYGISFGGLGAGVYYDINGEKK